MLEAYFHKDQKHKNKQGKKIQALVLKSLELFRKQFYLMASWGAEGN